MISVSRLTSGFVAALAAALLASSLSASAALAEAPQVPQLTIQSISMPSRFVPGRSTGDDYYQIEVRNIGSVATSGTITVTDVLPAGVTVNTVGNGFQRFVMSNSYQREEPAHCAPGTTIVCTWNDTLPPNESLTAFIPLNVAPDAGPILTNQVEVSGGGAPSRSASEQTVVSSTPADVGLQMFKTTMNNADGSPSVAAGSHPYRLNLDFQFNTQTGNAYNQAIETPKRIVTDLPPGLVINPQATTVRCTESEFQLEVCPDASAVGFVHTGIGVLGGTRLAATPIYNMVAPRGVPAVFGFVPVGFPIFVHIIGHVRADGGYALSGSADNILSYGGLGGLSVTFWGDPTNPTLDHKRSECAQIETLDCAVPRSSIPFLTTPTACSSSLTTNLTYSSWQHPDVELTTSAQMRDLEGNPFGITGCDQLEFAPTLVAKPTTNVADSPSGLDVDLHVPQTDSLDQRATSNLKGTVVTLPEGITVNPSAAGGLDACSSAQIGLMTPVGQPSPVYFNEDHAACPDAAKVGTAKVTTPLVPDPLPGSVYLAKPFDNPFGSFLALYIVIDDPQSGVVVKLAGKVESDPDTGRLTTSFDDNPQLPFSDFALTFFGGSRGTLRTPPACGSYTTESEMTPWSGNPAVGDENDYSIDQAPSGGSCEAPASQPNAPSFDAGTISPLAGAYSPFVLNLDRTDGSQQFSKVTLSPPPGLVAKLAGTPPCSDAQIAVAQSRTQPGEGALEQSSPSCPAASRVGGVDIAAGAGPAPYWAHGEVYLGGPYKGEPLSFVIITPAVAGPFDLGVVVTRVALHVDPATAQITADADPIPDRLVAAGNGFLLDVRSVRLSLDKPDFTRTGTSCDPSSVFGSLLSVFDQNAALNSRFQLAECVNLGFRPKFSLKLKGSTRRTATPKLIATVRTHPGEANIAFTQVKLPKAAFLDNAHIGTVCTRVQFAAQSCPPDSVYGRASAISPLLDYPLEGSVYLRANPEHELPDLVAALRGPPSQPIEIDLAGKTDSVKGALRNTFEMVPDAPVSYFRLELFGGRRGLIELSSGLCASPYATVRMNAQNGNIYDTRPRVKTSCRRHHRAGKHHPHG